MNDHEIISGFHVRHIMALLIPGGTVNVGTPMDRAKAQLEQNTFDYGVVSESGRIIGLVARAELQETDDPLPASFPVRGLELKYVLPEATLLSALINHLVEFPFQLVVSGKNVVGLVDESDLNKHPVYAYFYCLLGRLEENLAKLVFDVFPKTEDWCTALSADRWEQIATRWREACKNQRQLDPLFYACFADFTRIAAASTELLAELGFPSKSAWLDYVGSMDTFRNDIMHPVRDLLDAHRSLAKLAEIEARLKHLVERTDEILSRKRGRQAVRP
jgi:hypothetical protein